MGTKKKFKVTIIGYMFLYHKGFLEDIESEPHKEITIFKTKGGGSKKYRITIEQI